MEERKKAGRHRGEKQLDSNKRSGEKIFEQHSGKGEYHLSQTGGTFFYWEEGET